MDISTVNDAEQGSYAMRPRTFNLSTCSSGVPAKANAAPHCKRSKWRSEA